MATTVDRFLACWQLCQQVADMQNNIRAGAQIIQAGKNAGTIPTFAAAQVAARAAGQAHLQRLTVLTNLVTPNLAAVTAGLAAFGVDIADVAAMRTLLITWATNLSTATITNQTQLDTSVAALLAAVPAAMQPY